LSGQIAAAVENIPEEWSVLDTNTINYPAALDDTFPIAHISSLVARVTQDSSYRLWFPGRLFPVWPGKCKLALTDSRTPVSY